ncbi:MAG: transposase [Phycisphaerales bacterium]
MPDNIVILLLPPKSPEINPVERLWHFMRSDYLSNRAYHDYAHIRKAAGDADRALTPQVLRSVCRCEYTERAL